MQKDELLDHVEGIPSCKRAAIKLARRTLSDEELQHQLTKSVKVENQFAIASTAAGVALGLVGFYLVAVMVYTGENAQRHTDLANTIAAVVMGGGTACGLYAICRIVGEALSNFFGHPQIVDLLTPISETEYCKVGVEALETGGPLPSEWRDIALQERSQLSVFDVYIMNTLAAAERAAGAKRSREEELAKACRVLHGVPTPL